MQCVHKAEATKERTRETTRETTRKKKNHETEEPTDRELGKAEKPTTAKGRRLPIITKTKEAKRRERVHERKSGRQGRRIAMVGTARTLCLC